MPFAAVNELARVSTSTGGVERAPAAKAERDELAAARALLSRPIFSDDDDYYLTLSGLKLSERPLRRWRS